MKQLASIVFLLIIVNLLISCTWALTCYTCNWYQGKDEGKECALGGKSLPESSERNADQELTALESAREAGDSKVEACITFYGVKNETGQFIVLRGLINISSSLVGRCSHAPDPLDTFCACNTDYCNSEVPPGILKCHLCIHTAEEPNQGCISATNTVSTPARKAGAAAEGKTVTSKVTAAALDLRKGSQSAARQDPNRPNKYQVCYTFEGTADGLSGYVRGKTYVPEALNGCYKAPPAAMDQGVDGTYCFCSTDLCNSQPGKASSGTRTGRTGHRELGSSPVSLIIFLAFLTL